MVAAVGGGGACLGGGEEIFATAQLAFGGGVKSTGTGTLSTSAEHEGLAANPLEYSTETSCSDCGIGRLHGVVRRFAMI